MGILTIENEIITKLQTDITDLKIEGFPEKPDEYQLLHPKGAVLISYTGSIFSEPEGFIDIAQVDTMEFAVLLMIRGLRDKNGAYSYLDLIKDCLTGFQPTGCNKMYPTDIGFLKEDNAIWYYTLGFKTTIENMDYD